MRVPNAIDYHNAESHVYTAVQIAEPSCCTLSCAWRSMLNHSHM